MPDFDAVGQVDPKRTWFAILTWWEAGGITQALLILTLGWAVSHVVRWGFSNLVHRVTARTKNDLDDRLVEVVEAPVKWTVQLLGLWYALGALAPVESVQWGLTGVIGTVAALMWTNTLDKVSHNILEWLADNSEQYSFVNRRTLPVFDFAATAVVYGGGAFMICEAWEIDTTGWLASAGVVGVAVGFASQETLSNLIAGVFILADAPYKLGDFLELGNGTRGKVVEIGIRTTRLITADDVEIIVPNAMMANSQIVNQSGGPWPKFRVVLDVGVAYGSDIDAVRAMIHEETADVPGLCTEPPPRVRFMAMGDSALIFALQVWVEEPSLKEPVTDILNTRVYKRLTREGVEIPYPKHDVYLYNQG